MQALKLVKQIMAVDSSRLPREVVRTVVAVSGHKEDNFRRVCLETLQELAVADPRVVAHANGFRVLLAAAIDPANQDLTEPLVTTLTSIIEDPATRRYVRPHLEIHQLLTGFTDLDAPPGPERAHRWQATRKALVIAMRTWAGVHLLASDSRGLVTLMRLLRDPSASFSDDAGLQDSILETIVDIFDPLVGMDRTTSSAEPGRESKLSAPFSGRSATLPHKSAGSGLRTRRGSEPHNLLLSYATLLCAAFVHCGLIPSLTTLSISAGSEKLRTKAATLLVDVLHLCAMLLSQNQCTRLLSMPGLVEIAAESLTGCMGIAEGGVRSCHLTRSRASRASDLVRLLHGALGAGAVGPVSAYFGQQGQTEQPMVTIGGLMEKVYEAESAIDSGMDTHQSQGWEPTGTLEQMRKELRVSIESSVEKSVMEAQMNKSKVLATKDWTKWDWDVVDDIVQDILPHSPRGGGGGLHNMRWDPDHIRHIACAGRLYSLLLQQQEGLHFLQTDARGGVLQETVKELQALVTRRCSGSGSGRFAAASKVFDMDSCQRNLSGGYITLLFSVAAGTEAGRQLLSDTGLWDHLARMGSQPELDYMSRLILAKIDLASEKCFPRDQLESWMTTGSRMRIALRNSSTANRRLRDPVLTAHGGSTTPSDYARSEEWCIEMLVAQVHGDDPAVARAALSVLEEATQDERCLRTLVLAKPDLIHKPGANDLLMRFLSIPEGIVYLEEHGWVEQMVREWKDSGRTTTYADSVDMKWKTHVNDVEHVEEHLSMEPMSKHEHDISDSGVAIPIRMSNMSQDGGVEVELLMSLPWNIEVMLSTDSTATSGLQLRLDTFVDTLPKEDSPSVGATARGAPGATKMVVRGILVDSAGKPTCHPLEAHLTIHARLCVGACAVDRRGNVQWSPTSSLMDKHTAPFGRSRSSRPPRSQWSPQHGRADHHSSFGTNTMYRGVQGMQDFGPGRELPEDPSDMEHQLFWSTCRPHQRVPPSPLVVNPGSDNGKDDSRSGLGMHTVSPLSNSLHDEALDGDEQEAFLPAARADPVGKSDAEAEDGETLQESARSATCGRERVVRVPNETARWVFTNQPQSEDTISTQVVENSSVTYLKAVEMTISLKDMGPAGILLPPHLYGELAKTERGCELLQKHGDLNNLLHIARNSGAAADDRKGALWAVAHVSSWPLGLALLEELRGDVVGMLLKMCTSESHLSVWGTLFCVVSLVARTARGRAAIRAAGWESARDPSTSAFLPQDPTVLFQPVPWEFEGSLTRGLDQQPGDPIIDNLRKDLGRTRDADILDQVVKLSSHISRKEAMRKLSRMRKDKAFKESFTNSLPVFLLVHQLLADYSFSLPMRRYIFELFEQVAPGSLNWEPYVA
ncbi:conserved unknown protein [Ectocarpus siliculosus]|uniref:Rapamycin-insensitive companion of mTOR domain-containing protein n=1 Tax=Ectocarpus siliculosus TaxID=2880 RepID=D8LPP5_ECTSI|nr:conserved unknown protein [Ectocarpus siliculosus]|eukprot:CBN77350.1 conserved unknown protein [Ectocarpus siliculosus]